MLTNWTYAKGQKLWQEQLNAIGMQYCIQTNITPLPLTPQDTANMFTDNLKAQMNTSELNK